jgi:hypothetical protein
MADTGVRYRRDGEEFFSACGERVVRIAGILGVRGPEEGED